MERVVVTGGAGFLGSRLVQSFLDEKLPVRAVGHLSAGSPWCQHSSPKELEFRELDLSDRKALAEAFAGQNVVIHTAAKLPSGTDVVGDVEDSVNVDGTRYTIDACLRMGVSTLLHVSTTAAIGISPDPGAPADESFEYNLRHSPNAYRTTKLRAERMVLDANGPSLRTLVVNPGFMFGSHRGEFRGEEVIARVLQSRVVVCTSGGLSVVHVDDVVDGVRRAVARGRAGERYILSGENVSFHEIAETVVEVSNRKKLLVDIPRAIGGFAGSLLNAIPAFSKSGRFLYLHPAYAYPFYDSTRARQELGYQARPFREIVSDYLHFSRERRLTAPAE